MSGAQLSLFASVFLACAVEAVEAFTIVLAVGSTRKWSSTLLGVACATVALAVLIAALGPALTVLPLEVLRVVVGGLLLVFGLQWLRKAILRAGGAKALHDETAAFEHETDAARRTALEKGLDSYSFAISFKAVLLEGLEVAFIVLTFGANQDDVPLAALAAALAVVAVLAVGLVARAPLARVPENAMKFVVGVLLTTFGLFWGAEGAGAAWPGGDAALPVLALVIFAASWLIVRDLRGGRSQLTPEPS
ncbi:MAG: TMEM165/GDT1 family protein [Thermoleophilia bacterium]|nr:TMEM165/GDT1 family protein [Thermoleophilia bacterium]